MPVLPILAVVLAASARSYAQRQPPCRTLTTPSGVSVYTCSGATNQHVASLVANATDSMGLPAIQGPRPDDSFFVGMHLMAWIDSTGYYSKMNGLWSLNGEDDDTLDFTLLEPDVGPWWRPVNMLVVGEKGDGQWSTYYMGAEHYEFPRFRSDTTSISAWASYRENQKNSFSGWCPSDHSDASWATLGSPQASHGSGPTVTFSNKGPLLVEELGSGSPFKCGDSFPFNNQKTGDMEMITSYTFEHSSPSFNRSYQLINKSPYDYSTVNGVDKLIGGPVLTTWPKPHYLKQLHHFEAQNGGSLVRNTAFDWTGDGQNSDLIDVIGSGSVTFSATGTMTSGRSISMTQPGGIGDFGKCLCSAFGGFELTGSVLAGETIKAGASSPVSTRTYTPGTAQDSFLSRAMVQHASWSGADRTTAFHPLGSQVNGKYWAMATGGNNQGYLYALNYIHVPGSVYGQATFLIGIGNVSDGHNGGDILVTLDVALNGNAVLASEDVPRSAFFVGGTPQRMVLQFQVPPGGGDVEARVYWHNKAYTRLDGVVVSWLPQDTSSQTLYARDFSHQTGAADGSDWAATVQSRKAYMAYGPRMKVEGSCQATVEFQLAIDVVQGGAQNDVVASLDVYTVKADGSDNGVVASLDVTRKMFKAGGKAFQGFSLTFTASQALNVEPRVFSQQKAETWFRMIAFDVTAIDVVQGGVLEDVVPSRPMGSENGVVGHFDVKEDRSKAGGWQQLGDILFPCEQGAL